VTGIAMTSCPELPTAFRHVFLIEKAPN